MRILYIGNLWEGSTALQRAHALEELGHSLALLDSTQPLWGLKGLFRRVVRKFSGHSIDVTGTNQRAIELAKEGDYDIAWIDKGLTIKPGTLRRVQASNASVHLVSYSPDDMMGKHNQSPRYLAGISLYEEKKTQAMRELDRVELRLNDADIILAERKTYLKELKKERDQAAKFKDLDVKIKRNNEFLKCA